MTRSSKTDVPAAHAEERPAAVFESGVVPVSLRDELRELPLWRVVREYLRSGTERAWVEGYAARSAAFEHVLAMLQDDWMEDADRCADADASASKRGVLIRFPR